MARAYHDDLRRAIFHAYEQQAGSFAKLAKIFDVSLGYIEKIFRQRKQSGRMERVRHRPGRKALATEAVEAVILDSVMGQPDLTIAEIQQRITTLTGVRMSWSTVRNTLQRLKLQRKKSRSTRKSGTRK